MPASIAPGEACFLPHSYLWPCCCCTACLLAPCCTLPALPGRVFVSQSLASWHASPFCSSIMGPLELVRPNQFASTHQSLHSVMLHESVSPTGLTSMWALCMELGVHIQQTSPWQRLP